MLCASIILFIAPLALPAQQADSIPAFPGAEGFGSYTPGGRGGRLLRVTNLDADGPGSLQWALDQEGPRVVVFDTCGVIRTDLIIRHGGLTILGQTAPGCGITVRGMLATLYDATGQARYPDIVIRFLRLRPDSHPGVSWADALQFSGVRNCVLDHMTFSWGSDETVDIYTSQNMTVQWCSIEESETEGHSEGRHNYGLINGPDGGRISIHHNLFAHHARRNPALGEGPADVRNNVIYNFRDGLSHEGHEPDVPEFNLVGNYYRRGPSDTMFPFNFIDGVYYHVRDTYIDGRTFRGMIQDPWDEADSLYGLQYYSNRGRKAAGEFEVPPVTTHTPQEAYELVLDRAGCFPRDTVSRRTVAEVRERAGQWGRRDPGDLMAGLPAPAKPRDTDRDGMPDAWERGNGLDPADSTDHATVMASGYTAIEQYANMLAAELVERGESPPPKGDLDGNGRRDIFDLLALLRKLTGSAGQDWEADLNYDGRVDIFDLLEMLRQIVAGGD